MYTYDFGERKEPCGDCWNGHCTMNCGPCIPAKENLRQAIARRAAARGRPLTDREKLMNLTAALGECDGDCASHVGEACSCGAVDFRAKFGPGKHTP